jgi:hypothetical protein
MKRVCFGIGFLALLAFSTAGLGGPVQPFQVRRPLLPPLDRASTEIEFKGGQRASALAMGDGSTYLGLYVFDVYGNCVAWDDEGTTATLDDLAVEWFPTTTSTYLVEVRNCGLQNNKCKIVLR